MAAHGDRDGGSERGGGNEEDHDEYNDDDDEYDDDEYDDDEYDDDEYDDFEEESDTSESVPGRAAIAPQVPAAQPESTTAAARGPLRSSASASASSEQSGAVDGGSDIDSSGGYHAFPRRRGPSSAARAVGASASTPALSTPSSVRRNAVGNQPFRNRFGQLVLPKPLDVERPPPRAAHAARETKTINKTRGDTLTKKSSNRKSNSNRKSKGKRKNKSSSKRRPRSAMTNPLRSPARGMDPPRRGPGAGRYRDLDTFGSQSLLLRNARPTSASFSKSDRFSLLGSGDPNAYRGRGIPGPGLYRPIIPRAIKALNPLVVKPRRTEVLSQDRFDGTNCTWTGTGFYYCSRSDMERREFPGPGLYQIKDTYLSTNTAATGGGRFNESKPLSFVDVITNRARKLPGPNQYRVNDASNAIRPNKCAVVGFGPDLHRDSNGNAFHRPGYQEAFDYDPHAQTPAPWQYDPKEGVVTFTKM